MALFPCGLSHHTAPVVLRESLLQAMRDRGLSNDFIDLFANMSQEKLTQLTEHQF